MEKLTSLTDPETNDILATFRNTPMKELMQQGDEQAKALLALSSEQESALKAAALEAAFVEGSVNFLFLYLLLLRLTNPTLIDFVVPISTAGWDKTALVRQLVAHLAALSMTETPVQVDTFQLKEADIPLLPFKMEKLRIVSFPDLAARSVLILLPFRALRSLDEAAFVDAVAQHNDLAVISFLLTLFSAEDLVTIAIQHSGGQLAFIVALLWRLVHPLPTDHNLDGEPAIAALLLQLKQEHPTAYSPVISYFKDQVTFLAGFVLHLASLNTLPEMRQALASIPIGATANPKSTAALVTAAFHTLQPGNKALFQEAAYDRWKEWCEQQIGDPNVHLHQLPVSSFETAIADHFLATLTPDTAVEQSRIYLAALRSIDAPYFESRLHLDKTVKLHFAHLQFIAPSLPTPLPPDNHCIAIANGLLADPIWTTRHLRSHPNHIVLEELLRLFTS